MRANKPYEPPSRYRLAAPETQRYDEHQADGLDGEEHY
jgi:hypothetical protein